MRIIIGIVLSLFVVTAQAKNFNLLQVAKDIDVLEMKIKKERSNNKKVAYLKKFTAYLEKQKTPKYGLRSQYKDLILSSFKMMDYRKLAKKQCVDVERELYNQFSPHERSIASAPVHLLPALRIISAFCN